jgi:hypothetical protein
MRRRRAGLLLAIFAFVVYMSNGHRPPDSDTVAARFIPFSILEHGSLYLDPVREVAVDPFQPHLRWWAWKTRNGHLASLYPIWTPILVTPLYVPAVAWLSLRGRTPERLTAVGLIMEKTAAALISAGAAFLMYLTLLRRGITQRNALLLGAAFAFATGTWSTSSQALWQHPVAELLLTFALWLLAGPAEAARVVALGATISLSACNRPPDAILAAGIGIAAFIWAGRRRWLLVLSGLVPAALTLGYDLLLFGHPLGAYGLIAGGLSTKLTTKSILAGVAGLLVSPTRGLFVFTPWLLFSLFGVRMAFATRKDVPTTICLVLGLVGNVLFLAHTDWRAGWSYGPRFMVDAVPVFVWLVASGVEYLKPAARMAFIFLIVFSLGVEIVGAYCYRNASDIATYRLDVVSSVERRRNFAPAWDFRNTPFVLEVISDRPYPETIWKYFWRL